MNLEEIKQFVHEAGVSTYASGDESLKQKQSDNSTTIVYSNGAYSYHDNYFGGEPYGGREVVFHNNKPVWMMVYYGFVYSNASNGEVYRFLMEALRNSPADSPARGPSLFEKEGWKYETMIDGDFANFSGIEKIYKDGACLYEARYIGGLVDKS